MKPWLCELCELGKLRFWRLHCHTRCLNRDSQDDGIALIKKSWSSGESYESQFRLSESELTEFENWQNENPMNCFISTWWCCRYSANSQMSESELTEFENSQNGNQNELFALKHPLPLFCKFSNSVNSDSDKQSRFRQHQCRSTTPFIIFFV